MTIGIGDPLPSAKLTRITSDGLEPVDSATFFKGRRVALFAVPGAFTPTCSARHLPGFVEKTEALRAKGIDEIACTAVNDPFVLGAWSKQNGAEGITMLADGNADFASAIGLDMDGTAFGMGRRSQRYAMVVDDGVVAALYVEAPGEFRVSSAEHLLDTL
ncbi:peroxiredoxin [Sphingomonas endophytica]|uniref:Glutathione-dependent peroxiredoxin n=1 Tax=Sphingomonas endophytica TaxID=869719 RepID=A0A147I0B0_9SPHN|nr:peroxiredoxin [Sphingomonas endophytica]KTT70853.1 alkyl hydroperoxide reductase [Sphingomonas endophytica]